MSNNISKNISKILKSKYSPTKGNREDIEKLGNTETTKISE